MLDVVQDFFVILKVKYKVGIEIDDLAKQSIKFL